MIARESRLRAASRFDAYDSGLRVACVGVGLFLALGCEGTIETALPAPASSEAGATLCSSDADCSAQHVCAAGSCQSLTGYACTFSSDCRPPLTICANGTCQLGCTSNAQCGSGSVCTAGVCTSCSASSACAGGCTTSSQCSNGEVCDATTRQCRPCVSNVDCSGAACVNGACQPPCTSNTQCSTGQACVSGACGPCSSNAQCGTGQVCTSGSCQVNNPCPTWSGQISTFMNNYCTGCHGSMGSLSSVQQDASRIQSDIDSGRMPTGAPYPTQIEINTIDRWFSASCNMP